MLLDRRRGLSILPDPLVVTTRAANRGGPGRGGTMNHPIVHAEIRSADPDATRAYFVVLFGWPYPTEGAFPGYTFVETGVPGALYTAISPLQDGGDLVTFFVAVEGMDGAMKTPRELG